MEQEGFKRKLTAILNADVEGLSRLMDDDEEATARTLTSYKYALFRSQKPCDIYLKPVI